MALVGGSGEALTLEDMTKMATAVMTRDLDALHSEATVDVAVNSPGDGVEESRPAATRVKLCRRLVQRRVATGACVDTLIVELVVGACAGALSAFLPQNTELGRAELRAPLALALALGKVGHVGGSSGGAEKVAQGEERNGAGGQVSVVGRTAARSS